MVAGLRVILLGVMELNVKISSRSQVKGAAMLEAIDIAFFKEIAKNSR